jgi:signal transduction histidine kinase
MVHRAAEGNKTIEPVEYRVTCKDGRVRLVEAFRYYVNEHFLTTFIDVTDRRRAEEALLRSEKLASVGRMAATVAHEINNPLEAVTNTIFLARNVAGLPEAARQYLEIADDELARIAHITRQALGFYRETSAPTAVSVNSILDSAVGMLRGKITAKKANIEKQYDVDLQVTAVSGELRQVISNLLANSLDAIDEGGTVKLRTSRSICANSGELRIRITVADNGKGIPTATLPRIFEPLYTTKDSTGSGLGLWVCKQIIDKHGGHIYVRSCAGKPHRGTVFSVVLSMSPDRRNLNVT